MISLRLPGHAQSEPGEIRPQDVIAFLNQTIAWQQRSALEQQLATDPADILFLSDNRQLANQIVRLSFDFARAEAELLRSLPAQNDSQNSAQDPAVASRNRLVEAALRAEQQVKRSESELESLRGKLDNASGKQRRALESAIAETVSELELARTRRDVIRDMLAFMTGASSTASGPGGLQSQIDELARGVPAAEAKSSSTAGQNQTSASPSAAAGSMLANRRAEPAGILAIITDVTALSRKLRLIDESTRLTEALAQSTKTLRTPLGAGLRELVQRGDQIANQPESHDPAVLQQQKRDLDNLTTQLKQRSEVLLPLAKQRVLLDLYKRNLTNWRNVVSSQYNAQLRGLAIRASLLAIALALVVGSSQLARKAVFRYVRDARRRYQLLLIRRIVLWFVIALIIAFAFATELGSLATFAGLMTAGIAVALQNVILSIAGYFFLIGKYGVRIGDRVQVAGVTGEVVDIGLVRLHLMELDSGGTDPRPTGRVVVFSNSIVFQPNAGLFKQIPGTNFVWHEITFTLAPESNYRIAEERLIGAVNAVFGEYRERMEGQRQEIEKTLSSVSVSSLHPQSRLRLTQGGLEVVIRYPVDLHHAAKTDDRIARELLDAIEREPKLKLVGSGTPNIQPVATAATAT
ncbi:MAG: mechanosensitive ion channel domain-containing protein [Terriglobales bacterium]